MLLSVGFTFDDILDLSWDQIHLAAECILVHKSETLNMVLEPLMGIFGGKLKRGKVTNRKRGKQKNGKNITPLQKEQMLINKFRSVGLPVTEK